MTSVAQNRPGDALKDMASGIRSNSGWFLALGVLQIIAGVLAVSFAISATIASIALLGSILLVAAGAQIALAVLARSWSGFFLFLLLGILYGVTGGLTLLHPLAAAEGLTLMLSAALLVAGAFRMAIALTAPIPSRGWVLINGVITVLLGMMIAMQWPVSGLWVIGAFVGIELIANGITWSVLAAGVRSALAPLANR